MAAVSAHFGTPVHPGVQLGPTVPMRLYKYFSFNNSDHWAYPAKTRKLYFANPCELRSVNDLEFDHQWDHPAWFFAPTSIVTQELKNSYDKIFNDARTLCLSRKSPSSGWDVFCPDGGVCYEFEYDENAERFGVVRRPVTYSKNLKKNVPNYFLEQMSDSGARAILSKIEEPAVSEKQQIWHWLNSSGEQRLLVDHIVDELVFKKRWKFHEEDEYRYIHPEKGVESQELRVRLENSSLPFDVLGLRLLKVHTTDLNKAKSQILDSNIPLVLVPRKNTLVRLISRLKSFFSD